MFMSSTCEAAGYICERFIGQNQNKKSIPYDTSLSKMSAIFLIQNQTRCLDQWKWFPHADARLQL